MKPMNFDSQDPKLTAFALGEIEDEKERSTIEEALEGSSVVRDEVEEIREMAKRLREELGKENARVLSDKQRRVITDRATKTKGWKLGGISWLAAAAMLVLVFGFFSTLFLPSASKVMVSPQTSAPGPPTRELSEEQPRLLAKPAYSSDPSYYAESANRERDIGLEARNFSNTESYSRIQDNDFLGVVENPLSTFSIDVDTASYSNVRRFLNMGQLPPRDAVRIEELINYFSYDYPVPDTNEPFSVHTELASAPWSPEHRLLKIGIKGREIERGNRPLSNLVFLIDVSGSMQDRTNYSFSSGACNSWFDQLGENDRVAIVVYAGASGLILPSTPGDRREGVVGRLGTIAGRRIHQWRRRYSARVRCRDGQFYRRRDQSRHPGHGR